MSYSESQYENGSSESDFFSPALSVLHLEINHGSFSV